MTERLTTLAAVKDWLDIPADQVESDPGLIRVLDAASQFTLGYLNRDTFGAATYTQNFKGNGKQSVLLRNWPILTVTSVGVYGTEVFASTLSPFGRPSSGYTISDPRNSNQSIDLNGGSVFSYGAACQIVYEAGYRTSQDIKITSVTDDTVDPPVTTVVPIITNAGGQWVADISVLIDGLRGDKVASDPVAGEYAVDQWGVYTFSLADVGRVASITYSYCPWDVSFGVTEMIGEWYKRKDRIGLLSKTLGGQETVTFSQKDISDTTRSALQTYMNVVPI